MPLVLDFMVFLHLCSLLYGKANKFSIVAAEKKKMENVFCPCLCVCVCVCVLVFVTKIFHETPDQSY